MEVKAIQTSFGSLLGSVVVTVCVLDCDFLRRDRLIVCFVQISLCLVCWGSVSLRHRSRCECLKTAQIILSL